uniref:Uncharacterized protein n=1 Tax=Cajanus cajan TaxID=3821 RepID=A0A151SRD5_CAJCA|nr:hypothetical protein KK1_003647 [Cajanus cajan]
MFTRLSATLRLFSLKARIGWTDNNFTELLELLKEMLPEDNMLPNRNYEVKKILCPMGLEYKKIHACPNDCILYTNDFATLKVCLTCGLSRFKKKTDGNSGDEEIEGPPAMVLWYLPIIPRFKRLFAIKEDAKNLTWHENGRKVDKFLRHPTDSPQWKRIDKTFPEFGVESRNLRIGLATDGMNPYGNLSSKHNSWPVLLVIYNLPAWLCMKRKYIMLSMMISGPRQPGNDIDVYLSPLIDEFKLLWEKGVEVFDAYREEEVETTGYNLKSIQESRKASLEELIGILKVHELELQQDDAGRKQKSIALNVQKTKSTPSSSRALKAEEAFDESCCEETCDSDDEISFLSRRIHSMMKKKGGSRWRKFNRTPRDKEQPVCFECKKP